MRLSFRTVLICLKLALQSSLLGLAAAALAAPITIKPKSSVVPAAERENRSAVKALVYGDLVAAKRHYEAALKSDPRFTPALIGLANVAQGQGNLVQAEAQLKLAELSAPQAPEVHLAWGRYWLAKGDRQRGEAALQTSRRLGPRLIPPLLELGALYASLPGRSADALRAYRQAVAIDPNNPYAQYGLGLAAVAAGQRIDALIALQRAAELSPTDPAPHRAMGRMYLEAGHLDMALEAFDAGLARQSGFVPLMLDRADALGRSARWSAALEQLQRAEDLAPKLAEIPLKVGDVHQANKRWDSAQASYLRVIELDPKNAIAHNNLAWMTLERKGNATQAVDWARKAVALSPGSSPFHDTLGWAERAAGNLPSALASTLRAIEIEPKVAGYHFHLGVLQGELKRPAQARAALLHALELDAALPEAEDVKQLLKSLPAS